MNKTAVANELVKLARELSAGEMSVQVEFGMETRDFAKDVQKFASSLDEYLKYLEKTKKSMTILMSRSHNGDEKADYENLVRRTKEKKDEIEELLSLLEKW